MKAVRLHSFHQAPVVDEVPEPKISGPLDVIVKIGGAAISSARTTSWPS